MPPPASGAGHPHSPTAPARDARLLGLIGEQVSDLTYVQPDQVAPAPVQLRQMPFLDAIVQTEEGIIQLIAVERIREAALGRLYPGSGNTAEPSSLESRHSDAGTGGFKSRRLRIRDRRWDGR